ncbi:hypothetical protein C095_04060 [Fusobacterium necrophorum subsp. funduliforme B35]|uniref:MORN repeat protein n=1 Tax=Fusobacterium necrophorum subsp. funduliforme B35 TaxID=1226633 RepID=A0A0B4FPV4_9FUSO|nr:hypothetical protein C095_04060 [Fusobacterium necrophorum subsp. funduliforme B35]
MNGSKITYYENGKVREILNFQNNLLHGKNIQYYPSGEIQWVHHYSYGELIDDGEF